MVNEKVVKFHMPKNSEDWILLQTDHHVYSLRLGGFKREVWSDIRIANYTSLERENYANVRISKIFGDNEWLYIVLDNDHVIASGWVGISKDGEPSLGVVFKHRSDYEIDFFENDIYAIGIDDDGSSIYLK